MYMDNPKINFSGDTFDFIKTFKKQTIKLKNCPNKDSVLP